MKKILFIVALAVSFQTQCSDSGMELAIFKNIELMPDPIDVTAMTSSQLIEFMKKD